MIFKRTNTLLSEIKGNTKLFDPVSMSNVKKFFYDGLNEVKNLSTNISYRSNYYVANVDKRFNIFSGPGVFYTILVIRFAEISSIIDPDFRNGIFAKDDDMPELVKLLRSTYLIDDFKDFTKNLTTNYGKCKNFVEKVVADDNTSSFVRLFFSCLTYIQQKIENENYSSIREDVIDRKDFCQKYFEIKTYKYGSKVLFKDIIKHHSMLPILDVVVKLADKLNDYINVPLSLLDEDIVVSWGIVIDVYRNICEEMMKFTDDFHKVYNDYIKTYATFTETGVLTQYIKLCYLSAMIKINQIGGVDENIKLIKDKLDQITIDIPVDVIEVSDTQFEKIPSSILKDLNVYANSKIIVEKALKFVKEECLTCDDVSFVSQSYWYENNKLNELGLMILYPHFKIEKEEAVVYPVSKDKQYLLHCNRRKHSFNEKNFSKKYSNYDLMRHDIIKDGNSGLFNEAINSNNKFLYVGDPEIKFMFFERFKKFNVITSVRYEDENQKHIVIEVDKEKSLFSILDIPANTEYMKGYNLNDFGLNNSGITKPVYRYLERDIFDALVINGSTPTIISGMKHINPISYLLRDIKIGFKTVEAGELENRAVNNVKNIIDGVSGKKESFNLEERLYDPMDVLFTSKSKFIEELFGVKNYITIHDKLNSYPVYQQLKNDVIVKQFNRAMTIVNFNNLCMNQISSNAGNTIYYQVNPLSIVFATIKDKIELKDFSRLIDVQFNVLVSSTALDINRSIQVDSTASDVLELKDVFDGKYVCEKLSDLVRNQFKVRKKRLALVNFVNKDFVRSTENKFRLINSEFITNENVVNEFLNMIAQLTASQYNQYGYTALILDHAEMIVDEFFKLVQRRPVIINNVMLDSKFFEKTYKNFITGIGDKKDITKIRQVYIKTLVKISCILNQIKSDIKSVKAHPAYLCDCLSCYTDFISFEVQKDEVKMNNQTIDSTVKFDCDIWDILYKGETQLTFNGCYYIFNTVDSVRPIYYTEYTKKLFSSKDAYYTFGPYKYKRLEGINTVYDIVDIDDYQNVVSVADKEEEKIELYITVAQALSLFKKNFVEDQIVLKAMTQAMMQNKPQKLILKKTKFDKIAEMLKDDISIDTIEEKEVK